jgi:hypothetical protein
MKRKKQKQNRKVPKKPKLNKLRYKLIFEKDSEYLEDVQAKINEIIDYQIFLLGLSASFMLENFSIGLSPLTEQLISQMDV